MRRFLLAVPLALALALALSGCARSPGQHRPTSTLPLTDRAVPKVYQWLNSGEAAALSRQSYAMLTRYVLDRVAARRTGTPVDGVVLVSGEALETPRWSECGTKPAAVIFDMDETAILNTGANYDAARLGDPPFDPARWDEWEKEGQAFVDPVPGALEAMTALRAAGVMPLFVSNRQARFAEQAAGALEHAGLGPISRADQLYLRSPKDGSGKDLRRDAAAARYCVLAMAGDQLGDFSDLFNARGLEPAARRALTALPAGKIRWGQGWFLIPNPAYGPGDAGTLEQVFPDHRWPGPATKESK